MKRSSIKMKEGLCEVEGCGYHGALIAKKCKTHYWRHREQLKKNSSPNRLKTAFKESYKKKLDEWFDKQIGQIPTYCEECGTNLGGWRQVMPRAIIAHILPKRLTTGGFPEVATEPENRMFYCPDCHNRYDNRGWSGVRSMKSFPLVIERLVTFADKLSPEDYNRLPDELKEPYERSNEKRNTQRGI